MRFSLQFLRGIWCGMIGMLLTLLGADALAQSGLPQYWLGVQLESERSADSLLDTPFDRLRVVGVVPGSPADNANIQPGDLILRVNDEVVHQLEDLHRIVAREGDRPLLLQIRRDQGNHTFRATATKRPTDEALRAALESVKTQSRRSEESSAAAIQAIDWLEQQFHQKAAQLEGELKAHPEGKNPELGARARRLNEELSELKKTIEQLRTIEQYKTIEQVRRGPSVDPVLRLVQPGRVLPPGTSAKAGKLPENAAIEIRKEGSKPYQVIYRQAGETAFFEVKELSELPERVRQQVYGMLGGTPEVLRMRVVEQEPPKELPKVTGSATAELDARKLAYEIEKKQLQILKLQDDVKVSELNETSALQKLKKQIEESQRISDQQAQNLAKEQGRLKEMERQTQQMKNEFSELQRLSKRRLEEATKQLMDSTRELEALIAAQRRQLERQKIQDLRPVEETPRGDAPKDKPREYGPGASDNRVPERMEWQVNPQRATRVREKMEWQHYDGEEELR